MEWSDTYITLLPGDYFIFDLFSFHFYYINFFLTSWQSQSQVRLICEGGDFSIAYRDMRTISIRNVEFYNGGNDAPIISVLQEDVSEVNIQTINCTNCSEGFLELIMTGGSATNISHCIFQGSTNNFAVKITSVPAVKILVFDTVFANDTFSSLMINKYVGKYSKVAAVALERFTVPSGIKYGVLLIHHCHFITTLLIMVVLCLSFPITLPL